MTDMPFSLNFLKKHPGSAVKKYSFRGGIHPDEHKEITEDLPISDKVMDPDGPMVFPMQQHVGAPCSPLVKKGDKVLRDQIINYYDKGGEKPMVFLHVHNAGRLLSRCEKTFIKTHEELGRPYKVINCNDSYTRTYEDFRRMFTSGEEKTGYYICYRDSIACAVQNAAMDSGLVIPRDVEILSLIGTKYAYIVRPTLTTMHIDMIEVGKRAMYMLTDLLNRELVEKTTKFEATFIQAESTIKR